MRHFCNGRGMCVAMRPDMNRNLSRRKTLGLLAALPAGWRMAPALATPEESLGEIAAQAGITYGASAADEIFSDVDYLRLYERHCRIITSDVALKFDWLRPERKRWDWLPADRLLAFAERNGMRFRGHALIWNENAPKWLRKLSLAEIRRVFDEHIDTVVGRYAGRIAVWDVVNEPFWPGHGNPHDMRGGPWYEAFGPSYVERAFRRAHAADPEAVLALNEAHCEGDDEVGQRNRAGMKWLVGELLDAGAPVHALGFQGHLQPQLPFSDPLFAEFLSGFGERGLRLHITELDVNDEAYPDDVKRRDALVARRYHAFLRTVLTVPQVEMVINWQLADPYSWYAGLARKGLLKSRRRPRPLPFDERYRRKPAWFAMARAFRERRRA